MRVQGLLLPTAIVASLVAGCGTHQVSRYSALSQVSTSKLTAFKRELQKAPIKNIELPTDLPFTVTVVRFQSQANPPHAEIQLYGKKDFLYIDVFPDPNNIPPSPKTFKLPNVKSTSLPDGSKAWYGNNGSASMLNRAQGGAVYSLSSTNAQGKPDLTVKQLVSVANSFK